MSWEVVAEDSPWSYGSYLVTIHRMMPTGPECCVSIGILTEEGWIDEDMTRLPVTHWMELPEAAR
jgi:hypothetical protein